MTEAASRGRVRPLRADARRKHTAILDAAAQAFADSGVDVPLEEIARRAEVGIATVFRHFPTRTNLITEVYLHDVDLACAGVEELLARLPADEAMRAWLARFVAHVASKRGMAHAVQSIIFDDDSSTFKESNDRIYAAISRLLDAATAAGLVRPGIDRDDIMKLLGGVALVTGRSDRHEQAERLVTIIMDGLR